MSSFNQHKKPTTLQLAILTSIAGLTTQTAFASDAKPTVTLDPIVVTASLNPTKTTNLVAQTTVIDEYDLQRYQGQTVIDVIKQQPSINFKQTGGTGTVSNFYLRGYDSKQVLVLIDGVRYSAINTGQAAINLLPVEQIERIEILHGASGASIYGADAMGGVIQIFTKAGDYNQFSVTAGIGSNNHYLYGATGTLANDTTNLTVSATRNQTDGIDATVYNHSWGIHNADKDGFESNNANISLKHKLTDNINTGFSAIYADSITDFDNGQNRDNVYTSQQNGAAQAFIDWQYAENSSLKLQYGHSIDDSETFNAGYESVYKTDQDQVNIIGIHALPLGKAIYGAGYLNQSIDSTAYEVDDRDVSSVFAGYQIAENKYDLQTGVRYSDNSQYGEETTYNIGAAFSPNDNFRFGANYATGFRAPTYNELYAYGGNPNLKPETSKNAEIFAEYSGNTSKTRITAYQNKIDNMIGSDANFNIISTEQAKIEGISLNSDLALNNYIFGLGYDYQKATDDNSDNDTYENILAFRPIRKGQVYAGYTGQDFDIRFEYEHIDDHYSNVANLESQKIEGYGLVNFKGNYYLTPALTLSTRINNLTNKKYVTTPEYNTDGTNVFGALTYTWY